jgi:hypothetical protein
MNAEWRAGILSLTIGLALTYYKQMTRWSAD